MNVAAAIRAVVLFGLVALILRLFVTGEMVKYMSPALDPLTALAGAVTALLGLFELRRAVSTPARAGEIDPDDQGELDQGQSDRGAGHWSDQVMTAGVILVPVLVGLLMTPRALGVEALGGEPVGGLLLTLAPTAGRQVGAPITAAPIEDVPELIAVLRDQGDAALGRRVRATGIVAQGSDLADDELALLRFSIAHCVADARPLALLIVAQGAQQVPSGAGGLDQWVLVEGTLTTHRRDGEHVVTIEAERIERVSEPANPYLRSAF